MLDTRPLICHLAPSSQQLIENLPLHLVFFCKNSIRRNSVSKWPGTTGRYWFFIKLLLLGPHNFFKIRHISKFSDFKFFEIGLNESEF